MMKQNKGCIISGMFEYPAKFKFSPIFNNAFWTPARQAEWIALSLVKWQHEMDLIAAKVRNPLLPALHCLHEGCPEGEPAVRPVQCTPLLVKNTGIAPDVTLRFTAHRWDNHPGFKTHGEGHTTSKIGAISISGSGFCEILVKLMWTLMAEFCLKLHFRNQSRISNFGCFRPLPSACLTKPEGL